MDGNVGTWTRIPWILGSNSILIMQTDYQQLYQVNNAIEPMKHFIPVKNDFSDLVEKYNWLEANPEKADKIIQNANSFIQNAWMMLCQKK